MGKRRIDLTGQRFSRLVVIEFAFCRNVSHWRCRCDCGNESTVDRPSLVAGRTKSCGCIRRAQLRTHGKSKSGEYAAWSGMRERCHQKNHSDFRHYGGRGIEVCQRWDSFENFLADMGPRPSPKHSIDRFPDPNGNYEPGNCRWATQKE